MATPEYLENLGDTELCDPLCEAEVLSRQRTLSSGGGIPAIALRGDAGSQPSLVDGTPLMLRSGLGRVRRGVLSGIMIKIRVSVRYRGVGPESVTEQEMERIFE